MMIGKFGYYDIRITVNGYTEREICEFSDLAHALEYARLIATSRGDGYEEFEDLRVRYIGSNEDIPDNLIAFVDSIGTEEVQE